MIGITNFAVDRTRNPMTNELDDCVYSDCKAYVFAPASHAKYSEFHQNFLTDFNLK